MSVGRGWGREGRECIRYVLGVHGLTDSGGKKRMATGRREAGNGWQLAEERQAGTPAH